MGITGLIPFVEKASSKINVKELRGCTVAVDTYCWLHKGTFSCADKLCRGEDTDLYVQYCLKYVTMLLSFDIKPILVFDGRHLPAKSETERRRRQIREQSRKRAAELLQLGRTDEARSHMRRCVDVTHNMALRLIKECRKRNVDCIVAPYEADAQMAFLDKINVAQYIITEDSDLILFGCRKVIFKLDLTGHGLLVNSDKLHLAMGCREEKYTFDKFRVMCILSGCDYLDSLPGIGLAKACKFILMTAEEDMNRALRKIPQYLNMRHLEIDEEYIQNFLKADATFKHMYVFNPFERRMERLHDLSVWNTDLKYCSNAGETLDDYVAFQLALGNLNPFSLKSLDSWSPDDRQSFCNIKRSKHKSIWQPNFQPHRLQTRQPTDIRSALVFKSINYSFPVEKEEAKPDECEIVSIYNNEDINPRKRRCSSIENDDKLSTSPTTPVKRPCNPFVVRCPRERKPILEELVQYSQQSRTPESLKKSISSAQIEVRSRFFAANVALVGYDKSNASSSTQEARTPTMSNDAIAEEVSRIERMSEQNKGDSNLLYTYDSPSPVKSDGQKVLSESLESIGEPTSLDTINSRIKRQQSAQNKIAPRKKLQINGKKDKPPTANQTRLSMFGFQKKKIST